jgi:hypothetical protein
MDRSSVFEHVSRITSTSIETDSIEILGTMPYSLGIASPIILPPLILLLLRYRIALLPPTSQIALLPLQSPSILGTVLKVRPRFIMIITNPPPESITSLPPLSSFLLLLLPLPLMIFLIITHLVLTPYPPPDTVSPLQ